MPLDLTPEPATVHWGFFDGALAPVAAVASGDVVTIHTVSGGPEALPPPGSGMTVRPEHRRILAAVAPGPGPHILTGPIAVRGAVPGDALRVEILEVSLRDDWGFNLVRAGAGALPDLVLDDGHIHMAIDRRNGTIRMPWGLELPARPFFGVIGTAPPPEAGRVTSIIPGAFGGNIDNKELTAGAVLHLPVWVAGAQLSVGDGHAAQGDGEVCLTAVETGLTGRFRIDLVKRAGLTAPWAETPGHVITMGFDPDLDEAARIALRAMIALIGERTGLSAGQAYRLCSVAADLRVTQLVNRHKGIHAMLPRAALAPVR